MKDIQKISPDKNQKIKGEMSWESLIITAMFLGYMIYYFCKG